MALLEGAQRRGSDIVEQQVDGDADKRRSATGVESLGAEPTAVFTADFPVGAEQRPGSEVDQGLETEPDPEADADGVGSVAAGGDNSRDAEGDSEVGSAVGDGGSAAMDSGIADEESSSPEREQGPGLGERSGSTDQPIELGPVSIGSDDGDGALEGGAETVPAEGSAALAAARQRFQQVPSSTDVDSAA